MDVFYYILDYVDNVDIRRSFGIYCKINMNKYTCLDYITRIKAPEYKYWGNYTNYARYNLRNLYDVSGRELQCINNDMIEMQIDIINNKVYTVFGIHRLQKKNNDNKKEKEISIHKKGDLDDYYWDYIYYQHVTI